MTENKQVVYQVQTRIGDGEWIDWPGKSRFDDLTRARQYVADRRAGTAVTSKRQWRLVMRTTITSCIETEV